MMRPSTRRDLRTLCVFWKSAIPIAKGDTKMTEFEMAKLGSWRFSLHLKMVLDKSDSAEKTKTVIGFEAANAAAGMEPQLTPEEHAAYYEGVNYALQQWLVGSDESGRD